MDVLTYVTDIRYVGSERQRHTDATSRTRRCRAPWQDGGMPFMDEGRSLRWGLPEPFSPSLNWEECALPFGECHCDEDLSHLAHSTEMTHYLQERFKGDREMEGSHLLMHQWAWLQLSRTVSSCQDLSFLKGEQLRLAHLGSKELACKVSQAESTHAVVSSSTSRPPGRGCASRNFKNQLPWATLTYQSHVFLKEKKTLIFASAAGKLDSISQ